MIVLLKRLECINPIILWQVALGVWIHMSKQLLLQHLCQIKSFQSIMFYNESIEIFKVNLIILSWCIDKTFFKIIVYFWDFEANLLDSSRFPIHGAWSVKIAAHWIKEYAIGRASGCINIWADITYQSLKIGWLDLVSLIEAHYSEEPFQSEFMDFIGSHVKKLLEWYFHIFKRNETVKILIKWFKCFKGSDSIWLNPVLNHFLDILLPFETVSKTSFGLN